MSNIANLPGLTPALDSRIPGFNQATGNEGAFQVSDVLALKIANSSFVATAIGMTTAQTGTVTYSANGNSVVLDFPAITGTSNATTFTLTGVPAAIRPATAKIVHITITDNGGAATGGRARIETDGTITIFSTPALGAFTAASTKSITAGSAAYTLA